MILVFFSSKHISFSHPKHFDLAQTTISLLMQNLMTAVCSTILNFKASLLESRSEFEFQCRSAKRIGIEIFSFFSEFGHVAIYHC